MGGREVWPAWREHVPPNRHVPRDLRRYPRTGSLRCEYATPKCALDPMVSDRHLVPVNGPGSSGNGEEASRGGVARKRSEADANRGFLAPDDNPRWVRRK